MTQNNGKFWTDRRVFNHWIFTHRKDYYAAWSFMISEAEWNGDKRGGFTCSQRWLADKVGLSHASLRRLLEQLQSRGMVEIKIATTTGTTTGTTSGTRTGTTMSTITICNYNKFQAEQRASGTRTGTTTGTTSGTIYKKERKKEIIKDIKPSLRSGKRREDAPATAKVQNRGSRIDREWKPSAQTLEGLASTCPGVDVGATLDVFVDYWDARPGAGAVKLNWDATFRNWCRKEQKDNRATTYPTCLEAEIDRQLMETAKRMDEGNGEQTKGFNGAGQVGHDVRPKSTKDR